MGDYLASRAEAPFTEFDLVVADNVALSWVRERLTEEKHKRWLCRLRLLTPTGGEGPPIWVANARGLEPRQMWALHPVAASAHSTFLGFALDPPRADAEARALRKLEAQVAADRLTGDTDVAGREQRAALLRLLNGTKPFVLVWGKHSYYFGSYGKGDGNLFTVGVLQQYLRAFDQAGATVVATLSRSGDQTRLTNYFTFVVNVGLVSPPLYAVLLSRAAALVGIGHPVLGRAFLYAWARGTPVVNPVRTDESGDHMRGWAAMALGLEPSAPVSTQVPYCDEEAVVAPRCIRVDPRNQSFTELVAKAVVRHRERRPEPLVDANYAVGNYLVRLRRLLRFQLFCNEAGSGVDWARVSAPVTPAMCPCPLCPTCALMLRCCIGTPTNHTSTASPATDSARG